MSIQYSALDGIQRALMCQTTYPGMLKSVGTGPIQSVPTTPPVESLAVRITTRVDLASHPALPASTYHILAGAPERGATVGDTARCVRSQNGAREAVQVSPSRDVET